jgi:hypothetical protein
VDLGRSVCVRTYGLILKHFRISVTSRGNVGDLQHCNYPTIRGFHLIIQPFDTKFTTITPHSLVTFQLQHGNQVNNTLPINKPHIGLSKYIFQKLDKPNTLKNWEKTRKMWVKN